MASQPLWALVLCLSSLMVTIFSFCLAGISSGLSATCSAVVTSQVHPEPSLLMQTRGSSLCLPLVCPSPSQRLWAGPTTSLFLGCGNQEGARRVQMKLPKCQIREETFLLGFLLLLNCLRVFLMVYCPVLKRTPNETASRDLEGKVQHFFLAEL